MFFLICGSMPFWISNLSLRKARPSTTSSSPQMSKNGATRGDSRVMLSSHHSCVIFLIACKAGSAFVWCRIPRIYSSNINRYVRKLMVLNSSPFSLPLGRYALLRASARNIFFRLDFIILSTLPFFGLLKGNCIIRANK